MKLKPEAHRAVNGFLDEFLYKILNSSGSLTTDRLRAGLLTILPTSVGKEAITEAEVELRAFLAGRAKSPADEDKDSFHLQWSFEVRWSQFVSSTVFIPTSCCAKNVGDTAQ